MGSRLLTPHTKHGIGLSTERCTAPPPLPPCTPLPRPAQHTPSSNTTPTGARPRTPRPAHYHEPPVHGQRHAPEPAARLHQVIVEDEERAEGALAAALALRVEVEAGLQPPGGSPDKQRTCRCTRHRAFRRVARKGAGQAAPGRPPRSLLAQQLRSRAVVRNPRLQRSPAAAAAPAGVTLTVAAAGAETDACITAT